MAVASFIWNSEANRGARTAAFIRALKFQIRARTRQHRQLTLLGDDAWIWAELNSPSSTRALYANPPDWHEMKVWSAVLKPGDFFIDVGANIGLYTIWAARCGAKVLAVEPLSAARVRLLENCAVNGFAVDVIEGVLSNHAGRASLQNRSVASHLVVGSTGERVGETGLESVDCFTLDDVLGDRSAMGMKVDVEGAERLVLEGGERALAEGRITILQLEWNITSIRTLGEDRQAVAALLRKHGYILGRPSADEGMTFYESCPSFGADVFAIRADQASLVDRLLRRDRSA